LQANCPGGLWPPTTATANAISDARRASRVTLAAWLVSNFMFVMTQFSLFGVGVENGGAPLQKNFSSEESSYFRNIAGRM
jgi:hypothetical protein